MNTSNIKLYRTEYLGFLEQAKELNELYAKENKKNPKSAIPIISADYTALRLIEKSNGLIIIGANIAGPNVNIHLLSGNISDSGDVLWSNSHTATYILTDFKNHRSIARAGFSVADLVEQRAISKYDSIKKLIPSTWRKDTELIRKNLANYVN